MAWVKRGTSALFLTETLLQFLVAYPVLLSSMSPDLWLKVVELVCGTEDQNTAMDSHWEAAVAGQCPLPMWLAHGIVLLAA